MRLWEPFQQALHSPLGVVFIGLIVFLLLLVVAYWLLVVRQRRRDHYAYLHRTYYKKAEESVQHLTFEGAHKADFFGRQTLVKSAQGIFGSCLIPPPDLADDLVRDRFRAFLLAIRGKPLPLFAPYELCAQDALLVAVQKGTLRAEGRSLLSLKQVLTDRRLVSADREALLLQLARALAQLHDVHAEVGGQLYHGFLLPRSLLLEMDTSGRISRFVVSDLGLAFAIGPMRMYERLALLRAGKLPIERFAISELLEQTAYLAPEQRDALRLEEVGTSADFYAFGALAIALFTSKRFFGVHDADWSKMPQRWQPFLRSCLEDKPGRRPKDFMELEDWLQDPELALLQVDVTPVLAEVQKASSAIAADGDLTALRAMLHHSEDLGASTNTELNTYLKAARAAVSAAKWKEAKNACTAVLRLDPQNAPGHVHMAIALYEMGDVKGAEQHYKATEAVAPQVARRFRQHIAFRL